MRTLTREFDFNLVYRILDILPFSSLFSIDGEGIPYRLKLFNIFEPQNTTYTSVKFNEPRHATLIEYRHLLSYLDCEELQKAPLDRRYDPVVNAIVSLVLSWTSRDREDFAKREPKYADFMHDVEDFVQYENGDYVYCMEFETRKIAYCKCAFKLIKSVFASKVASDEVDFSKEPFQISRFINPEFVNHLHTLYAQLMTETLTSSDIKKLEQETEIPYNLRSYVGDYEALKRTATVKFITGQACAGKTTLLNSLRDQGHWLIMSRGQIGSFSGKADNPCAVAALHASTEFVLRHSNVLGDRSSIDNPLWVGIMELCDPKYKETLVWELLRFLNSNLNAATIGYYINQIGVVFIDPYPSLCEKRMMARSTGGDIYRSRIGRYAIVQTMAYYIVARLFGWKIYCVPYVGNRQFHPEGYKAIARELMSERYFGVATLENPLPKHHYERPPNDRPIDTAYPKSVGIFK